MLQEKKSNITLSFEQFQILLLDKKFRKWLSKFLELALDNYFTGPAIELYVSDIFNLFTKEIEKAGSNNRVKLPDYGVTIIKKHSTDTGLKIQMVPHIYPGNEKNEAGKLLHEQIHINPEPKIDKEKPYIKQTFNKGVDGAIHSASVHLVPKEVSFELSEAIKADHVKKTKEKERRCLQNTIKKRTESRGYKSSINEPIPKEKGWVDVSLEKNGKRIACEIPISSPEEWEVYTIEECLAAGYDLVAVISTESQSIYSMKKKVRDYFNKQELEKIMVCTPDSLFLYLHTETAEDFSTETFYKGYRVKVEYDLLSEEEMSKKQEAVAQIVLDSIRMRKKE